MNYTQLEESKRQSLRRSKRLEWITFLVLGVLLLCIVMLCIAVTVYAIRLQ